jgi:hypothetical protein
MRELAGPMSHRAACLEGCDIFRVDSVQEEHGFLLWTALVVWRSGLKEG